MDATAMDSLAGDSPAMCTTAATAGDRPCRTQAVGLAAARGRLTRRRLLVAGAGGVLAAAATACRRRGPAREAPAAGAPARVTFMVPGGPQEDADFAPVFEAFAARYPAITAAYTPAGTGYGPDYTDKLFGLLAAGTAPDVFKTLGGSFGTLAAHGAYLALDGLVQRNAAAVRPDDFFPAHLEGGKFRGTLYSLPHDGAPVGLWVNVELFQRENLPLPSWDSTWDDLLRAGLALTRRDADGTAQQLGFGRPGWLYWIWSAGGDLYTADGARLLIDQPPAVEALAWLQDAVHRHRVCPTPQEQGTPALVAFPNGRIGAVFGMRGSLGTFRTIQSFAFDAAPIPKGPKGRVSQLGIGYTSIWSQSKVPEAAFMLLTWVCSAEGQRLKISRGYAHPSRRSLVDEPWFRDYRTERSFSTRINTVFAETLKRGEARAITPHPREAEIFQAVERNLAALWNNAKPAREVAKAIVEETRALLGP